MYYLSSALSTSWINSISSSRPRSILPYLSPLLLLAGRYYLDSGSIVYVYSTQTRLILELHSADTRYYISLAFKLIV